MPRALVPLLVLLAACEPAPLDDRFTIALTGGALVAPMDLQPVTVADGIDNNIAIDLTFLPPEVEGGEVEEAEIWQYKIDYTLDGESAPPIAGVWATDEEGSGALLLAEGATLAVTARAATGEQLLWVQERHAGGETIVPATLTLEGYVGTEKLVLTYDYNATFAEYE